MHRNKRRNLANARKHFALHEHGHVYWNIDHWEYQLIW
jgi:hypothetical protein